MRAVAVVATTALAAGAALTAAASPGEAVTSAPACKDGSVQTLITKGQPGTGSWFTGVEFVLRPGQRACSLAGFPGVDLITSTGQQSAHRSGRSGGSVMLTRTRAAVAELN